MTSKERYDGCLGYWQSQNPNPETELHYGSEFQLLCAVVLSAQCTDKRINAVTPALFAAYPTPEAMAAATPDEVLHYIKSVSYPNSKSRHLVAMAQMLTDDYSGQVPGTMQELVKLPGVGRKTANVMLGAAFSKPAIAVDTHVFRVSRRIGLATGKTPLDVELALKRHIAPELQSKAHHWILLHGRYVCKSQRPLCPDCGVRQWCKTYNRSSNNEQD